MVKDVVYNGGVCEFVQAKNVIEEGELHTLMAQNVATQVDLEKEISYGY